MKNSSDKIGNRTRDLPACSAMPHHRVLPPSSSLNNFVFNIPIIMCVYRDVAIIKIFLLFIRGNAMSGAPSIKCTTQFPNPPIRIGIIKRKL